MQAELLETEQLRTFAAPRRRLAPNVFCMFAEDRPPVFNIRRHGPLPRNCNVISFASRPRLVPGDIAEIWKGGIPSNIGKKVRLIERDLSANLPPGQWWSIESIWRPLDTRDVSTGQPDAAQHMTCIVKADCLPSA